MKAIKRTSLIISVALLISLIMAAPGWCDYRETKTLKGLHINADGFRINNVTEDTVVLQLLQPAAKVDIRNLTSELDKFKIKVVNISPELYGLDKGTKLYKGTRFVVYQIELPHSKKIDISCAPRVGNPKKFTFAVLGDSRHGTSIHKRLLEQIEKTDALFAVSTGDIVNHGTKGEYRYFLNEIKDFNLPYFVIMGNHEVNSYGGRDNFLHFVGPVDYAFTFGGYRYVMLDNSRGKVSEGQYQWLKKVMNPKGKNFVFMHIPPDSPVQRYKDHIFYSQADAQRFMNLMKKYSASGVFAGHIHGYAKLVRQGIDYIITGCAGASPYLLPHEGGFYHFVLVHVDGDKVETEVVKLKR